MNKDYSSFLTAASLRSMPVQNARIRIDIVGRGMAPVPDVRGLELRMEPSHAAP